MCALFKNRYRIGSKRFLGFDYSSMGKYFITICTQNKITYFGTIDNGTVVLSELGIYLKNEWIKTPSFRSDMNISLDEYVIMPDHFHAIITIGENRYNQINIADNRRNAMHGVSTAIDKNNFRNAFIPQSKNLSSIIRGVKSAVTIYAKKNKLDFQWQSLYYDHIIRTNSELVRIKKYIIENPEKWIGHPFDIQ
jgi:REP element-mobilizing transposase RayT